MKRLRCENHYVTVKIGQVLYCKSCAGVILQGTVGDKAGYLLTPSRGSVRNVFVSEHLGRVHNVVLIKCIFGSGKPQGVGILGKGSTWAK